MEAGQIIALALFVLLIILMIGRGLRSVSKFEVVIIERLGKYHATLTSGIYVSWPFIDKPRKIMWRYLKQDRMSEQPFWVQQFVDRIDMRETVHDFVRHNAITQDKVQIEISSKLYFRVTDPIKAVYEISNLPDAIEKLTQMMLLNIICELSLNQILTSRDAINRDLQQRLNEVTPKWGVEVHRTEIQVFCQEPSAAMKL
jgi:regulator of protease activity HflC (stomatin/prohibitin superfamily)